MIKNLTKSFMIMLCIAFAMPASAQFNLKKLPAVLKR